MRYQVSSGPGALNDLELTLGGGEQGMETGCPPRRRPVSLRPSTCICFTFFPLPSSPGSLHPQRKCFSISPSHARTQVKPQPLPQTRAAPPLREGQALLTTGRSSFQNVPTPLRSVSAQSRAKITNRHPPTTNAAQHNRGLMKEENNSEGGQKFKARVLAGHRR